MSFVLGFRPILHLSQIHFPTKTGIHSHSSKREIVARFANTKQSCIENWSKIYGIYLNVKILCPNMKMYCSHQDVLTNIGNQTPLEPTDFKCIKNTFFYQNIQFWKDMTICISRQNIDLKRDIGISFTYAHFIRPFLHNFPCQIMVYNSLKRGKTLEKMFHSDVWLDMICIINLKSIFV